MVTVARLESGICKDPGFAPASIHFFVLSASETGLLLVVKLERNVAMMRAGVKIMHIKVKLLSKKNAKLSSFKHFSWTIHPIVINFIDVENNLAATN